jgi:hypothetical protein
MVRVYSTGQSSGKVRQINVGFAGVFHDTDLVPEKEPAPTKAELEYLEELQAEEEESAAELSKFKPLSMGGKKIRKKGNK